MLLMVYVYRHNWQENMLTGIGFDPLCMTHFASGHDTKARRRLTVTAGILLWPQLHHCLPGISVTFGWIRACRIV